MTDFIFLPTTCPQPQMVCPRAWSIPRVNVLGEWRSNMQASGALCVVKTGPCPTLWLCVVSWDAGMRRASLVMHSLSKAPGPYGKPAICVSTMRRQSSNAHRVDSTALAVATNRMPVLSAQVHSELVR